MISPEPGELDARRFKKQMSKVEIPPTVAWVGFSEWPRDLLLCGARGLLKFRPRSATRV
jgi:hypothetical protein